MIDPKKDKELLFSLSKAKGDFIVQPFKGSGKGGQKRNKTMSACRIIHPASGARAECQEERSFEQNRKTAFKRLTGTDVFQNWFKVETARRLGKISDINSDVEQAMKPECILVEVQNTDGHWEKVDVANG